MTSSTPVLVGEVMQVCVVHRCAGRVKMRGGAGLRGCGAAEWVQQRLYARGGRSNYFHALGSTDYFYESNRYFFTRYF